MRTILLRMTRCLTGYAAAVMVASQSALAIMLVQASTGGGMPGGLHDVIGMMGVALVFTGAFSALPAALLIPILETAKVRDKRAYTSGGAISAVIACALMARDNPLNDPGIVFVAQCTIGGLAGGLAYWAVSGRCAGYPVLFAFLPNALRTRPAS